MHGILTLQSLLSVVVLWIFLHSINMSIVQQFCFQGIMRFVLLDLIGWASHPAPLEGKAKWFSLLLLKFSSLDNLCIKCACCPIRLLHRAGDVRCNLLAHDVFFLPIF